ncbi:MAG: protein translocase subunit SecDF [Candidatus Competibacteraceae bacterium]|nr:protein translocase subunit SecDF [Candidatus Competibacteraceae bacterium]
MQNKSAIQIFGVLVAIACIFHLSFTFVTRRVESRAKEYAAGDVELERAFLDSMQGQVVYNLGLVKYTYAETKQREINLGLDLKGGMNVTLEVSIPDLLIAMSNDSKDSTFVKAIRVASEQQKKSQANYVDLFYKAFTSINPQARLSSPLIFGHKDQEMINIKMTNEEVRQILAREADQAVDRTFEVLNARIDNFGVTQPNIQKLENSGRILVELPGVQDPNRVQKLLAASARLEFYETYDNQEVFQYIQKANDELARLRVAKTVSIDTTAQTDTTQTVALETVPDTTGTTELTEDKTEDTTTTNSQMTQEQFEKENPLFALLIPNIGTNESNQQFYNPGPVIGYATAFDTAKIGGYLRMPQIKTILPKDLRLFWEQKSSADNPTNLMALVACKITRRDGKASLEGDVITDASFEPDDRKGGFRVTMKMNAEGAKTWAELTKKNIGKSIAIVLDGRVYSYPNVEDAITGGISSITGNFTFEDAKTLASVLKAGKLPTPANIVEQAVVGPSLGKKAINAGLTSLGISFLLILVYMFFYYGKSGLNADIALVSNVFLLIGTLAALGATLTLPGLTGIVLTLGMSVDANVLIFERIKEELRDGKGLRLAVSDGYKRAYAAIIDSNITTLLIALILMIFGAGPVKSFAVVLFWGILTSLFSAIFITRLIFEWQMKRKANISFSTKATENLFRNVNIDFVSRRKLFYTISTVLVLGGIASFFLKGFNLGVDLQGGRSYTVSFDNSTISTPDIANALGAKFGSTPTVKFYGSSEQVKIVTKYRYNDVGEDVDKEIENEMYEALSPFFAEKISLDEFTDKEGTGISESYKVGPTIARDVKIKSIWAVVLSLIMMFTYILFRFKGWQYGLGAVIALAHDVIIVLALFSIFDGILPFNLEIDQAIIAAILTVIGYSINDTVIIFDRIREFFTEHKRGNIIELVNKALNSTIARTLNTSVTVLIVLVIAFLFGGEAIKGLSFAILIGVIVGTYSSIFIATPVIVDLKKREVK